MVKKVLYVTVIVLILIVPPGCAVLRGTSNPTTFDLQGHRGCRGLYPENTIPAMLHAVDLGVTTLEMDAVITKDKQVILSHDVYFNHEITTKPDGTLITESEQKKLNLYQMTYDEIRRFDVGMKVNLQFQNQKKIKAYKPTLSDVIDSVETYTKTKKVKPKFYNIETKLHPLTDDIYHPAPPEFIDLLVTVIRNKNIESRTIIQSFDVRTLQYLHHKYPQIKTSILIAKKGSVQQDLAILGFTPTIYSPEYRLVSQSLVKECKDMGMRIIPWTVNDTTKMVELKTMGVDGIITDYPNLSF